MKLKAYNNIIFLINNDGNNYLNPDKEPLCTLFSYSDCISNTLTYDKNIISNLNLEIYYKNCSD
jgi:hypothetical protein